MAAECGADGIFVSNHAGNTNDTAITPWDALPAIAEAAGDRLTIIADSGIRRGSDVIKALALGADIVAIGRATLYGVGADGEAGATRALDILESEILRTMAVMGLPDIAARPCASARRFTGVRGDQRLEHNPTGAKRGSKRLCT